MSRYTALIKPTSLPEDAYQIAWGYDRPLQEYFFTKFLSTHERIKAEEHNDALPEDSENGIEEEVKFSIMSHTTTVCHPDYPDKINWSNSEILELMEEYDSIPPEHKNAIAMDLPF